MTVLNIGSALGLLGLAKGWTGESANRMDPSGSAVRPVEVPTRRTRTAAVPSVREVERFEEECERWDGLS